jgi:N-acyl-D-aspartate/D-glutamate deacylase
MDPAALAAGIDWSFETFPEYLDALDGLAKGINFAANLGHSALRTWAMGERAFEEEADDRDLALMQGQLAQSLEAGAIGFTTSRTEHHETSDDRPVASRLASWEEVVRLVGVMGRLGRGIFEGADAGMSSPAPEVRADALRRMKVLAADSRVPMTFGMVATRGSGYLLDYLDECADDGARMIAQTHCRGISVLLSLKTKLPFDLLPAWHDLRRQPLAEQLAVLGHAERRRPLVDAAVTAEYGTWRRGAAWGPRPDPPTSTASGSTAMVCPPIPRWPTRPGPVACTRPRP